MSNKLHQSDTLSAVQAFQFYRLDFPAMDYVRSLVAQLIQTHLDFGPESVALVQVRHTDFIFLVQFYRDSCISFGRARQDARLKLVRRPDALQRQIAERFPALIFPKSDAPALPAQPKSRKSGEKKVCYPQTIKT